MFSDLGDQEIIGLKIYEAAGVGNKISKRGSIIWSFTIFVTTLD
jgi:hypothetical protein